ncbi:MAG: hypothetical protein K8S25_01465 [Alphaproteobacteria bacterium]|nr:hypothetical protein [Alphaproteobacteria bacterium]
MCSFEAVLTGVQAGAQVAQAANHKKQTNADAAAALQQGIYERQLGAADAEQIRSENARQMGTLRAAFGTRNVGFDSASMVDVLAEAAGNMDFAAVMKEHEGILGLHRGKAQAKKLGDGARSKMALSVLGTATDYATAGMQTNFWRG